MMARQTSSRTSFRLMNCIWRGFDITTNYDPESNRFGDGFFVCTARQHSMRNALERPTIPPGCHFLRADFWTDPIVRLTGHVEKRRISFYTPRQSAGQMESG